MRKQKPYPEGPKLTAEQRGAITDALRRRNRRLDRIERKRAQQRAAGVDAQLAAVTTAVDAMTAHLTNPA